MLLCFSLGPLPLGLETKVEGHALQEYATNGFSAVPYTKSLFRCLEPVSRGLWKNWRSSCLLSSRRTKAEIYLEVVFTWCLFSWVHLESKCVVSWDGGIDHSGRLLIRMLTPAVGLRQKYMWLML